MTIPLNTNLANTNPINTSQNNTLKDQVTTITMIAMATQTKQKVTNMVHSRPPQTSMAAIKQMPTTMAAIRQPLTTMATIKQAITTTSTLTKTRNQQTMHTTLSGIAHLINKDNNYRPRMWRVRARTRPTPMNTTSIIINLTHGRLTLSQR